MLIRFIMLMALTLCRDGNTVDGLAGAGDHRDGRDDTARSHPRR
jgi:hypothetical protein